jgi:hypothetical protein
MRQSWHWNRHGVHIPWMGGIYRHSWRSFARTWLGSRMNALSWPECCRRWSWGSPTPSSSSGCYPSKIFPSSQRWFRRYWWRLVSIWSTYERKTPLALVPETELWPAAISVALSYPACLFLFLFHGKTGAFTALCP